MKDYTTKYQRLNKKTLEEKIDHFLFETLPLGLVMVLSGLGTAFIIINLMR